MFIRTERFSEYVNSNEIVKLRAGPKNARGVQPTLAILRDDTVAVLHGGDNLDEIAVELMPVIAAAPGYEALWTVQYDDDSEPLGVIRHPVIGWRVDPYGGLKPVTYEDEEASNVSFAGVRYPDGRVAVPVETTYKTEEDWFKEMQEYEVQRRANKAVA